ncbi:MAG: hypothetical protein ABEN55_00470 [Bradymonadaceae bacterium]
MSDDRNRRCCPFCRQPGTQPKIIEDGECPDCGAYFEEVDCPECGETFERINPGDRALEPQRNCDDCQPPMKRVGRIGEKDVYITPDYGETSDEGGGSAFPYTPRRFDPRVSRSNMVDGFRALLDVADKVDGGRQILGDALHEAQRKIREGGADE